MEITIRFLGILSVKYGASPIIINNVSDYASVKTIIRELIGTDSSVNCVILRNGKPAVASETLKDGDEFCVFSPISGG